MKDSNFQEKPLRIAINAQLLPNSGAGGVESVIIGLIKSLGQLNGGQEEYIIIGPWQDPDWLKPYIGPNERIVCKPKPTKSKPHGFTGKTLGLLTRGVRKIGRLLRDNDPEQRWPEVPISDGFYEELQCDVIHFPYQKFTLCAVPSIYNPHDLQHLHYPQFFAVSNIAWRETIYPAGCHFAHTVVVASNWTKHDIVCHYRVPPDKIQIIPWAPPTQAYSAPSPDVLTEIRTKYRLVSPFFYYPAATWEHKNHLRLLDALALLRDREGLTVHLVGTGSRYPNHWPRIEKRISSLNLYDQVTFLGMVPHKDLRAIYRLAYCVIVPTLFEAASGPVFEAWQEGTPVACSTVTSLPEQVRDAGLLFDPLSVDAIAAAIKRLATDEKLCDHLAQRGRERLQDFSWELTAKAYRAVYRQAAGRPLTDEERRLLTWDWMGNTRHSEKEK